MKDIKWDECTISKPGMYRGIDLDFYHAAHICDGPSISSSGLRTIFNESPAHFFCEWRGNPNAIERTERRHFIVGRAVHHALLGQPDFTKLFVVQPDDYEDEKTGEVKKWNNNATACRAWHAKQAKDGKTVLRQAELEQIKGMALVLGKNPIIRAGALNGLVERSIFWKDKGTGLWLKSRPDAIPTDSGDFVDYKTTVSVAYHDIMRAIAEYGYHQQGALVREAARQVLGIANPTFTLVFQEKTPPYCDRVVTLKDHDLDLGMKQNKLALETFMRCLNSKHWPGPGGEREDAEKIEISTAARERIETRIAQMEQQR